MVGVFNDRGAGTKQCVWKARIDAQGQIHVDVDLEVHHGYATRKLLSAVLEQQPPTVYFLDGTTTIGAIRYESRSPSAAFDLGRLRAITWDNVDITAETRRTAQNRGTGRRSVHERLEEYLRDRPRLAANRWILCNDGSGEIVDYLVIEDLSTGEVALALWHAKGARKDFASVRIDDFRWS